MSGTVVFHYRAARPDGVVEAGVLEAADRDEAVAALTRLGSFPIELSADSGRGDRRARVTAEDLAMGLRALASLLQAGLPISRALATLDGLVPSSWAPVLPALRARVQQGGRLSEALKATGLPFPSHAIGVIEGGEVGSGLAPAVEAAARLLEDRAATRAALRSALAYPVMLALAGTGTLALLVGIVLPRFVELFADAGQTLPLTTRVVLGLGEGARVAALPVAILALGLAAAHRVWTAHPPGRLRWHELLRRVPVLGVLRLTAASASASSALAALLRSGVPVASALPAAASAAGDEAVRARLLRVRDRIVSGESLSSALEDEAGFTSVAIRLVRVGEETGDVASMLGQAARIDREQVAARVQQLTRWVEPTLVLAFGAVVLFVASALLQSMYGLQPTP